MAKHRLEIMITFDDEASCEAVHRFIEANHTLPALPENVRIDEIHKAKKYKTGTEELPAQQKRVLEFIGDYLRVHGYPPSVIEITTHLGVASTFGVRKHVDALIKKGFLERGGTGLSRALRIV